MAIYKNNSIKAKTDENTGFGTNASRYGGRFINKDGTANVQRRGFNFLERISWYHTMLELTTLKFLSTLFLFFVGVNFLFATCYYLIGIEFLDGIDNSGSELTKFAKAYFFSTQTFTTVGYGHISPNGFLTSALAAAEALVGLLSFSIATGLFFGRFSKPTAYIRFAQNALIAPFEGGKALMIRLVPYKNTNFTDAEAKVTLGMVVEEKGQLVNKFYTLPLEMHKINTLSLSWTLVHKITDESPLFGLEENYYKEKEGEFLVFIKTFDDMFSTVVGAQTSYTFDEIIFNAKFEIMYYENKDMTQTILDLDKLDAFKKM